MLVWQAEAAGCNKNFKTKQKIEITKLEEKQSLLKKQTNKPHHHKHT